jgi:diguanylate cyclase (GGDEF)-like protein/putative nucleotidyltransferase with HDIG domain
MHGHGTDSARSLGLSQDTVARPRIADGRGRSAADPVDRGGRLTEGLYSAELMARSLAYLFAAGGLITLVLFLLLPRPEASTPGMLGVVGAALAIGIAIEIGAERIPASAYPWVVACGSALVTLAISFRASPTTAHALFYLLVTFYSFYFFSRPVALLQLGLCGAGYALALETLPQPPPHALELWLMTVATLVVAGILLTTLKHRLDGMVRRLANAARTDALTGLLNRRGFEETFELELERARRGERSLSVLVGDLDNFKQINDRFGHHAGDLALARVSSILEHRKRRIDTIARLGGEEFALIVPDADDHSAYMLAERLRTGLRESFAADEVPVTISFGVASFPVHGDSYMSLLGAADDALYAAKELGRDRTVIYSREVVGILTPIDRPNGQRNEHLATVLALAEALDIGDRATGRHSRTVSRYAELIARQLGLPAHTVERVRLAGMLHDIGQIAISNGLLSKTEPLTEEERAEIRRHAEIGARILSNAYLADIGEWVLAHHERVDGDGFPFGIGDRSIPLEARILAVADAYEAMTSPRPYRSTRSHDEARVELRRHAGTQFDSEVVEAFLLALEMGRVRAQPARRFLS